MREYFTIFRHTNNHHVYLGNITQYILTYHINDIIIDNNNIIILK